MIQLTNKQNIEVFNSFSEKYLKVINEINVDNTISIGIINSVHHLFNFVASPKDPFATNTIMKPVVIAINEQVCVQLNLTQEEQYAMIAHEIGHILDKTEIQINNQLIREMNADQLAIVIGLSKELKSGLGKLMESKAYLNESNSLEND